VFIAVLHALEPCVLKADYVPVLCNSMRNVAETEVVSGDKCR
jgi:hypothetical protein